VSVLPRIWRGAFAVLLLSPTSLFAGGHHHGGGSFGPGYMGGPIVFQGGHGGRQAFIPIPIGFGGIPGWGYAPAFFVTGAVNPMYYSPMGMGTGMSFNNGGPVPPPPMPASTLPPWTVSRSSLRPVDPAKSAQLATIGDRLFRAGNIKRAAERYEQAIRLSPDSASPRVHLAQVALARGQITEAAAQIRAAVNAEPSWILNAPDIQAIYGEPEDFAKQVAKLESRVLVEPGDRDAWLVLGAELFLSGRTRRASDIFTRLSDRKADPALATFLDAARPKDDAAR
jgi:Tetratricopeptide repeat